MEVTLDIYKNWEGMKAKLPHKGKLRLLSRSSQLPIKGDLSRSAAAVSNNKSNTKKDHKDLV